jgi:hypothetical protein
MISLNALKNLLREEKLSKAYNTIKAQTTVKNFLKEFQKQKVFKIEFDTITDSFFEELSKFCFFDREIKNNYFAKIIAVLKTFLRWASEKGYNTSRDFEVQGIGARY